MRLPYPDWSSYQEQPFCVVKVEVDKNHYESPVLARTERIQRNDTTSSGLDKYSPGTQLYLDFHYERDEFIVRVVKYNATPSDVNTYNETDPGWVELPENQRRWLNSFARDSGPAVNPVTNGGNCANLWLFIPDQLTPHPELQNLIEQIRDYGFDIGEDRNNDNWTDVTLWTGWSEQELQAILDGLQATADAFSQITLLESYGFSNHTIFKNVMGRYATDDPPPDDTPLEEWLNRTENVKYFTIVQAGAGGIGPDGETHNGFCQTFNGYSQIVCFGPLLQGNGWEIRTFTEYTLVHELGHVFDNRVATSTDAHPEGFPNLTTRTQLMQIRTCSDSRIIVMGTLGGGIWRRGEDGWGSGPAFDPSGGALYTKFQQNPKLPDNVEEAAADMFLNWVYRSLNDNVPAADPCNSVPDPCSTPPPPIVWQGPGFLNEKWKDMSSNQEIPGQCDSDLSGELRYQAMHDILTLIFGDHIW